MEKELTPEELRKVVDSSTLNWKQIREKYQVKPLIGQQGALKALEFGIGNKNGGFNIYVSGYPGSGKLRAVNYFLSQKARLETSPGDLCYVNNFKDPYLPKKINLPQGGGEIFMKEISSLIDEVKKALFKAFESKEYADKRKKNIDTFKQKEADLFQDIYKKASDSNFAIR